MPESSDTICAVATPAGKGGVSIIRISGKSSFAIAKTVLGVEPAPRFAHYGPFSNSDGTTVDMGIGLFFKGPDSFTGEDILELHAHGGPILVDQLMGLVLSLGARMANPGEFSLRAFLNNKIDLTQAEAIADLIESGSIEATRSALLSLQGEFSRKINSLSEAITELRVYVEAAIDFPEEEVDFLEEGDVLERLTRIRDRLDDVFSQARQGSILREGLRVVIAGEPNAGKSSLLNTLSGQDRAIVTEIPGTTRDTLQEYISIDGLPIHIIDTAGLRNSEDLVEQEGIRRAWREIEMADVILFVEDMREQTDYRQTEVWAQLQQYLTEVHHVVLVRNKIDLISGTKATCSEANGIITINLSARTGEGIDLLREHIKQHAGYHGSVEGGFIARRRHLDALTRAREQLGSAHRQLVESKAGELLAEDLRRAHKSLGEITGDIDPDTLLGEIFSSFCIGK